MRCSPLKSASCRVVITGVLALFGLLCWQGLAHADESSADTTARRVALEPAKIPMEYADIYERLNRKVDVNLQKVTIDDALAYLQKLLKSEIILDEEGLDRNLMAKEVTLDFGQPVTIKYALRALLDRSGLQGHRITFDNGSIRLIKYDPTSERYILQTHDLSFITSYSTALRHKLIEQVRRDSTPDAWNRPDGPWIVPGTSVFTIDLYHRPGVHRKLTESLQETYLSAWHADIVFPRTLELGEKSKEELAIRAKELREQFPFESLAPRLKYEEHRAAEVVPLSPAAQERLAEKDRLAEESSKVKHYWLNLRRDSLAKLHSDEVEKFVAREGFGVSRMPTPGPSFLPLSPPPQLALPSAEIDPPQNEPLVEAGAVDLPVRGDLANLHVRSEDIFASPQRLGYVKDRDHVAGFGSHAFDQLPRLTHNDQWQAEPQEQWAMRRLELVSLLKHDTPRVYISDELPRLDKVGKAATRELGGFEADALDKLSAGEDVVTQASRNRIEMLGALRASKNCLECHDVKHGQLLGAFSYTLVRDPLLKDE